MTCSSLALTRRSSWMVSDALSSLRLVASCVCALPSDVSSDVPLSVRLVLAPISFASTLGGIRLLPPEGEGQRPGELPRGFQLRAPAAALTMSTGTLPHSVGRGTRGGFGEDEGILSPPKLPCSRAAGETRSPGEQRSCAPGVPTPLPTAPPLQSQRAQRALGAFQAMQPPAPTAITYSAMPSACEKGMLPRRASELLKAMRDHGLVPDVTTYNAPRFACEGMPLSVASVTVPSPFRGPGSFASGVAASAWGGRMAGPESMR